MYLHLAQAKVELLNTEQVVAKAKSWATGILDIFTNHEVLAMVEELEAAFMVSH